MRILFIVLSVLLSVPVFAQPKADFTVDKTGGCSPLSVAFTNTSTGTSANVIYEWSFDNGNISSLKNSSAIFIEERIYKVTLTVRDGSLTSTKSLDINVYKKPTLDFEISVNKGCFPLPVELKASANANGGTIINYFWDFGDGNTAETSSSSINHTYNYSTDPNINLTVTTSNGCQQTLTKEKLVKVLPKLEAEFVTDKDVLCKITDAATFTNKSVGPGTLSFAWEFGDGTTSIEKNPAHRFAKIGTYNIKLTTTSSEGCVRVMEKPSFINAANFKTDFSTIDSLCERTLLNFTNNSSPEPNESIWKFNSINEDHRIHNPEIVFEKDGLNKISLINRFGTCYDTLTKIVEVKNSPDVGKIKVELIDLCGAPARVKLTDTSSGGVKWEWYPVHLYSDPLKNTSYKSDTVYTYYSYDSHYPYVKVYNAEGCYNWGSSHFSINLPRFIISDTFSDTVANSSSCGPLTTTFKVQSSSEIETYEWDFGNGTTSNLARPTVTYTEEGLYTVHFKYKLKNGCTGVEVYHNRLYVQYLRKPDFISSTQDVCGNTPVTFKIIDSTDHYIYNTWLVAFEDGEFKTFGYENAPFYKFQEEGNYTIKLTTSNGLCRDTVVKRNYIKVSPPFPRITKFENTCDGDRGLVTFTQSSSKTNSWTWDFGDGSPIRTLNIHQDTIQHHYSKSGLYKVKLTNTNGTCIVSDSVSVPVLLKQHPKLIFNKLEVCSENQDRVIIENLEVNHSRPLYEWTYGYFFEKFLYGDGTSSDNIIPLALHELGPISYPIILGLTPGKQDFRFTIRSLFFDCLDTTNFVPVKINGPIANFKEDTNPCTEGGVVIFKDQSVSTFNNPIVKWQWGMGYEGTVLKEDNKTFPFRFQSYYNAQWITLKVTDSKGCESNIQRYVYPPDYSSIEAAISSSALIVSPGSTVNFYNNSKSSDEFNTTYTWIKSDGSRMNSKNSIAETYTKPGFYTVKLLVQNSLNYCSDTASITIQVKYINAAFDMNPVNINAGKCLPVVVRFNNKSSNITKINWDFGDGNTAENVFSPSHVYTKPGKYIVTAKAYSDNNTLYTTIDSVFIETPTPTIATNIYEACTAQDITLKGNRNEGTNYTWDLGDGTITSSSDSFFVHKFKNAGVYTPTLIQTDKNGCAVAVNLNKAIIIDSLSIALRNLPAKVCSPKDVLFDPFIYSVAADRANKTLEYKWNFGTGVQQDTSNMRSPSFVYQTPGTYTVSLQVKSPMGCAKSTSAVIKVFEGLGGKISGPTEICEGSDASFTASTLIPGNPTYKWILPDGTSSSAISTPVKKYTTAGTYPILLLVDNNGCVDSIPANLKVNPNPVIGLTQKNAVLCEGSELTVTASGGSVYQWSPSTFIDNTNSATVKINTRNNSTYRVNVTTEFGCSKMDSIFIRVAKPFNLSTQNVFTVCEGKAVNLLVSGASNYRWINNTSGLSNTSISNPVAAPLQNTVYTVVGTDADKCFTDTANVTVNILPLPTVNAGPDVEVLVGAPYQLQSTYSNDVVSWKWNPARNFSCSDCPDPKITPTVPGDVTLTVTSANGCQSTDTIAIKLLCSESRIYIPNAFTPDNNGKNDRFLIKGYGIKNVKYLRIYNRWGNLVFERTNFLLDDVNAAWDGKLNGKPVDTGTYVYVTEMSCNEQSFIKRGTVNVIQ